MEMIYEPGTKVIINPKYKLDYHIHTISDICVCGTDINYKLDNGIWFSDVCLLPCPLFKVGQKVQIDPDLPEPFTEAAYKIHFGIVPTIYSHKGRMAVITEINEDVYIANKPFEDGCCYHIDIDNDNYPWSSPMFNLKIYDNENQLQGEESVNRGRSNREGSVVCGRRFEASVAIGYLSHQACVGFQEH